MGVNNRPPRYSVTIEKIAYRETAAMSLIRSMSLLVVLAVLCHQSPSLPQPSISFAALGAQKDNLIASVGGFKKQLLAPLFGIKAGIFGAKSAILRPIVHIKKGLLGAKLGFLGGIKNAKLNLAKGILRPVAGIKRSKLLALRGLLDAKINKLASF